MNNLHDRATNYVPCNIAPFMIPVMYNKKLFQACSTLGVHWSPMAGLMACINWGDNNYKENNKKSANLNEKSVSRIFFKQTEWLSSVMTKLSCDNTLL